MTGYTVPDRLPYIDDYNTPADVPKDMEALAQATQAVLTTHAQNVQMVAPIGSIVMWPQASAPAGWHLCNGTAHGSDALTALLGSPNTPNLVDRFIVGAGVKPVGTVGGAETVVLTAGQSGLRDHAHGAWTAGASTDHSHYVGLGGGEHAHQVKLLDGDAASGTDGTGVDSSNSQGWNTHGVSGETVAGQGGHGHGGQSNGQSADHSHAVGMNGSGWVNATEAHENRPPFYALTYIIRKA